MYQAVGQYIYIFFCILINKVKVCPYTNSVFKIVTYTFLYKRIYFLKIEALILIVELLWKYTIKIFWTKNYILGVLKTMTIQRGLPTTHWGPSQPSMDSKTVWSLLWGRKDVVSTSSRDWLLFGYCFWQVILLNFMLFCIYIVFILSNKLIYLS